MTSITSILPTSSSEYRHQFPIFQHFHNGYPLAYLDTAASSQKPIDVIQRISDYYLNEHANIHRGAYRLSAEATQKYEDARQLLANFINSPSSNSIIFTRGTTEAINLVAHSIENWFEPGDIILLTLLEHHSNIVPWQLLAERKQLNLHFTNLHSDGTLDLNDFTDKVIKYKPKLCSFTHTSNATGYQPPLDLLLEVLKSHNCLTFMDAAQAAGCSPIDVQALNIDFLAFSGHKIYGPTGVGVLYARHDLLDRMQPFLGGGDMISSVTIEGSNWAAPPQKFEAGTPPIAEVQGLAAAINFINTIGIKKLADHNLMLRNYAREQLTKIENIKIFDSAIKNNRYAGILAFNVGEIHPHDLASVADNYNVQFRAGHHCAMPLMKHLGLNATARISFGIYNHTSDVDQLIEAIVHARRLFAK